MELSKKLFVAVLSFWSIAGNATSIDTDNSELITQKSYSEILPLEKQQYLTDLGYHVLGRLTHGEEIDFQNETFFDGLNLNEFKADVEYSKLAKFAIFSNNTRWLLSSSDDSYNQERKNRLTAIAAIMWAFTDLSHKKNSVFSRGAYTIMDPNHNVANFFMDYVKLVTGSDNPTETHCALTKSNFAYRRLPEKGGSSHHKGRTPLGQFGIDLRFESWETLMSILPFSMAHILFGQLDIEEDQHLLFVKPEPVGLGSKGEFMDHSCHFLNSGHVENDTRREKDINPKIITAFQNIIETSDLENSATTVRDMILTAKEIENKNFISETTRGAINDFNDVIESLYSEDNNEIRIGNEVILDLSQL